ncbi:MAG: hypothetical protein EXR79_17590 [Myxococcales bacterium]|nr:hypothetical protein [Myxococcales bacterium]
MRHQSTTLLFLCGLLVVATAAASPRDRADRGDRGQHWGPRHGERVRELPRGHVDVRVERAGYYYDRGVFYRPRGRRPCGRAGADWRPCE